MLTGVGLPLELAVVLCAASVMAGAALGQSRAYRRFDPRLHPHGNPLRDLMQPSTLARAVDLATHRNAMRSGSHAVLRGRIDQLAMLRAARSPEIDEQVREHVAAVMRAGLRRGDRVAMADGDKFTIFIPGANERAAVRIAERLRRKLAQLKLPQLGSEARLTASFGVASDREGEHVDIVDQRASRALDAATALGDDHVIPASEIEEIIYLPAPAPTPTASAA